MFQVGGGECIYKGFERFCVTNKYLRGLERGQRERQRPEHGPEHHSNLNTILKTYKKH